jgi:hypothetical protein
MKRRLLVTGKFDAPNKDSLGYSPWMPSAVKKAN